MSGGGLMVLSLGANVERGSLGVLEAPFKKGRLRAEKDELLSPNSSDLQVLLSGDMFAGGDCLQCLQGLPRWP